MWPPEVLELFGVQLSGKVLASVDNFDGTFNLLNVTEHSAQGHNNINSIILRSLKKSGKSSTDTLTQDTQAQGPGQTQAGSASAHHLSADPGKPEPQSHEKGTSDRHIYFVRDILLRINIIWPPFHTFLGMSAIH